MYKYSIYKPPYKIHPSRTFVDINLTGSDDEDKIKLDFAQLEIRELIKSYDTIKGVHFHFNNQTKYKSLVRAINICEVENAEQYITKGNDIWVLNTYPSEAVKERFSGLSNCIVLPRSTNPAN